MGQSWYDGWDTKPKLDEARVLAPDAPPVSPQRSRKNRRRWCRGKVGVEHVPEVKISKWGLYMLARYGPENPHAAPCGWREDHAWGWVDGERRWLGQGTWRWRCQHVRACATCGKVLQDLLRDRECPDWKPRTGLTKPEKLARQP